ncbi:hypothetical protein ABK040_004859 [Willaertia magna]
MNDITTVNNNNDNNNYIELLSSFSLLYIPIDVKLKSNLNLSDSNTLQFNNKENIKENIKDFEITTENTWYCHKGIFISHGIDKQFCICPEFSDGKRCERLAAEKYGQTFPIFRGCTSSWFLKDPNTDLPIFNLNIKKHKLLKDTVERFILWGKGRISHLNTLQNDDLINIEKIVNNPTELFFIEILKRYGPYNQQDVIILNNLLKFNQFHLDKVLKRIKEKGKIKKKPKIIFSFLISSSPERTIELFNNLYSKDHYYIFSISKLSSGVRLELEENLNKFKNVLIIKEEDSIKGWWGSYTLIYIELISYLYSFNNNWNDWDYILNLSESHFPLQSLQQLEDFIILNQNKEAFVEITMNAEERMTWNFIDVGGLIPRIGLTSNGRSSHCIFSGIKMELDHFTTLGTLTPAGGSQWHLLSFKTIVYMLSSRIGIELLMTERRGVVPDEVYFTTFVKTLYEMGKRKESLWLVNDDEIPLNNYNIEENNDLLVVFFRPNPIELSEVNVDEIKSSMEEKPTFFARKFSSVKNMILYKNLFLLNNTSYSK